LKVPQIDSSSKLLKRFGEEFNPTVFATVVIDRNDRRGKIDVCKCPGSNRDDLGHIRVASPNSRAAHGTKVVCNSPAIIADTGESRRRPFDSHIAFAPMCAIVECASRRALAGKAMAHRDTERRSATSGRQPTACALCASCGHVAYSPRRSQNYSALDQRGGPKCQTGRLCRN
jgi:hypothetical protein